jgi:hypothetical protein
MPSYSTNWNNSWGREVFEVQTGIGSGFSTNGYHAFLCSSVARTLRADGYDGSGHWGGYAFKPSYNIDQTVDVSVYVQY